ncbi:hypothetical protein HPB48_018659 [Haemaphysalis longicornis]|uniref:Uncharacterized protein n=1 Tax=Haemaphysalis longicornis TaxID=44386 RepID=A0A9J6GGP9_HAELO|nr:hypothetical protein HPB48_018659 [Haemaphysalis longicornis]
MGKGKSHGVHFVRIAEPACGYVSIVEEIIIIVVVVIIIIILLLLLFLLVPVATMDACLVRFETLGADNVHFVNEYAHRRPPLGKRERVSDQQGPFTDEHDIKLRSREYEEHGAGLRRSSPNHEGPEGSTGSVKKDSLRRTYSELRELVPHVRHGLDQLFNRFTLATDAAAVLRGLSLFDLRGF